MVVVVVVVVVVVELGGEQRKAIDIESSFSS